MILLQLPTEILLLILELLGSAFFRHNTRRLLVSKSWYELARLVLVHDLEFSAESLQRFLVGNNTSLVHQHTRTVSITLQGSQDRRSVHSSLPHVRHRLMISDCATDVANNLTSLAPALKNCRNLHSLKLKAEPRWRALNVMSRTPFSPDTLIPLLSVGHLTCLEFDTVSIGINGATGHHKSHICEEISTLLPTLRRLRCRMRRICPMILIPPEEGALSSLEEVIINLNIGHLSPLPRLDNLANAGSLRPVPLQGEKQTWSQEQRSWRIEWQHHEL